MDIPQTDYFPLTGREIRTIKLLQGSSSQRIQTRLEKLHLDSNKQHEYTALSYEWGPDVEVDTILVGESYLGVRQNLLDALVALRREDEDQTFWIDAICINQRDTAEKETQVQMMGDIYAKALHTVMWLGKDVNPDRTRRLFKFMDQLPVKRTYDTPLEKEQIRRAREDLNRQIEEFEGEAFQLIRTGFWNDMAIRPYFERTCIVQEVCLSQDPMVKCGANILAWDQFSNAAFKLQGATQEKHPAYFQRITGALQLEWIREVRQILASLAVIEIEDLVASLRIFDAEDGRDKIYGVLGMASTPSIIPDYGKSNTVEALFTKFVEIGLDAGKLDIITMRRYAIPNSKLPSWVPDWRAQLPTEERPRAHPICSKWVSGESLRKTIAPDPLRRSKSQDDEPIDHRSWQAHGGVKAIDAVIVRQTLPVPATILRVHGRKIGAVKAIGDMYQEGPDHLQVILNWERLMLAAFGNCTSPGDIRNLSDVYDQCLVIEDERLGRAPGTTTRQTSLAWTLTESKNYVEGGSMAEAFVRTMRGDRDGYWGRISPDKYRRFWSPKKDEKDRWTTEIEVLTPAVNRRFVIFEKGHLGLVHAWVETGNIAVVLHGCSIPVILREKGNGRFEYVGDAYIHGLMTGAAMEEQNREKFPEVVFEIE